MEYFMTFPWKMLQDISRGFQGNFYSCFLLHQHFYRILWKAGVLAAPSGYSWASLSVGEWRSPKPRHICADCPETTRDRGALRLA